MQQSEVVTIYTDGACRGNPGPGGWGAILSYQGREKLIKGARLETTNNQMELTAAIEALKQLTRPSKVELYTDSTYLRDGITKWIQNWKRRGWKNSQRQPVKNQALWQALEKALHQHDVNWHWVKAHSGIAQNERVDALANQAIDELLVNNTGGIR